MVANRIFESDNPLVDNLRGSVRVQADQIDRLKDKVLQQEARIEIYRADRWYLMRRHWLKNLFWFCAGSAFVGICWWMTLLPTHD